MITVTLFTGGEKGETGETGETGGKTVVGVKAVGHSGLAPSGSDILCAAVSAIVQTAYLAVADIAGHTDFKRDDNIGYFEFAVPQVQNRHDIDVVLRAMRVGLLDLQSGYPQNLKLEEA